MLKALKQMMTDNYGYYRYQFGIDPKSEEKIAAAEATIAPLREAQAAAEATLESTLEKLSSAGLDESLAAEQRTEAETAARKVKRAVRSVEQLKDQACVAAILDVAKRDETEVDEVIPVEMFREGSATLTYGEWILRFMEARKDHEYERWELLEPEVFE